MILKGKNGFYNFLSIESNNVEITLSLEYWYKVKNKKAYKKAKRSFTVHSWHDLIKLMSSFEEVSSDILDANAIRKLINTSEL